MAIQQTQTVKDVLISQRVIVDKHGVACDLLEGPYVSFFESHGLRLHPVSNFHVDLDERLRNVTDCQGLILSGGNDISPARYGEAPLAPSDHSPERDDTEAKLLEWAIAQNLPVLGVCRGFQFLNVHFGGRLVQGIEKQLGFAHKPAQTHGITIDEVRAQAWFGADRLDVNSYHNQGITPEGLSSKLKAFARTEDGRLVEGLYHPTLPIAGVQFHPERDVTPDKTYLKRLVEAFRERKLYWERTP